MRDIPGIHHVTAIGRDPGENLEFYTDTLGLRLVKRSVNQDDVSVYHLFYGDRSGSPGTSMTFFPYPGAGQGRVGTGQVSTTQFLIPAAAVEYWADRVQEAGHEVERTERFGETVLAFEDPDGLPLELVGVGDAPAGDPPDGPVPGEQAIRGFYGVTLALEDTDAMERLLQTMGYARTDREGDRLRYEGNGDLGYVVDVLADPDCPAGRPGAGTVHHVAFRVTSDEQADWRQELQSLGLRPTEIIDRTWFESVYTRTPGGILFEYATEGPGYTVDEGVETLGTRLVLPEWLEDRREAIENGLPALSPDS
ncbi:MAG: ring-cleaving dioxygenase [Halorhabdus sp.]